MRKIKLNYTGDLFAALQRSTESSVVKDDIAAPVEVLRFIDSPLVAETKSWIDRKAQTLGSLLAADRAVEYVAILRAFVSFRSNHEPEPLHEDLLRAVCGDAPEPGDEQSFKSDIRQLKEWGLISERIEKERLRGYRDKRRNKFRYRLCIEAVNFVEWLGARHDMVNEENSGDITGNLLDLQCSLLHELRRKLRAVTPDATTVDSAGDVLFRIEQMRVYVEATARTLHALNLRLLAFGAESFAVEEAKPVIDELSLFLERFGRRFGVLREDILQNLYELRRPAHAVRWAACAEALRAEASRFRHIASVRIPDAFAAIDDAERFYGADGALVDLMQRIVDSARKVWGKLNARLRELERRNHRLEDLGARLSELASYPDGFVPHDWLQGLLEPGMMRGDAQVRPGGELSRPPLPKFSEKIHSTRTVTWISPRTVGDKANVASIAEVRGRRLKEWLEKRDILPNGKTKEIAELRPLEFDDFLNVVQTIMYTRLGHGAKGRRHLGIVAEPMKGSVKFSIPGYSLECDNLLLKENLKNGSDDEN